MYNKFYLLNDTFILLYPLSDKYPSLSPYTYCAFITKVKLQQYITNVSLNNKNCCNFYFGLFRLVSCLAQLPEDKFEPIQISNRKNPVILVDPDGREIDSWELNFRTGELAWKNNSGGDNLQKVDVVDNGKNLFSFDLNTNKEQMKEYQNASNDFSLVGIGAYAEASASYGYGFAASVGEFNMFSEPDKTFQFADAGSYHGYDAGVGGGVMLIFGPKDMKGKDLEGWSVSLTGGASCIEAGIHTSASRDGTPTNKYRIYTLGLAFSANGGGISFSHTTVKEKPKNSGYWDRPHPHCFAAGTKIYTLNGFVDIQDLNIGDTIYAFNFSSKEVEFSTITKKHIFVSKYIFELTISNETILVTEDHPFYVREKGWVKVKDLILGDVIFLENKSYENVISIREIPWDDKVHNIEVAKHHNYFITRLKILVHNK